MFKHHSLFGMPMSSEVQGRVVHLSGLHTAATPADLELIVSACTNFDATFYWPPTQPKNRGQWCKVVFPDEDSAGKARLLLAGAAFYDQEITIHMPDKNESTAQKRPLSPGRLPAPKRVITLGPSLPGAFFDLKPSDSNIKPLVEPPMAMDWEHTEKELINRTEAVKIEHDSQQSRKPPCPSPALSPNPSREDPWERQMQMEWDYKWRDIIDRPRVVRYRNGEFSLRSVQVPNPETESAVKGDRYIWVKKGKGMKVRWKRIALDTN